MKFLDRGNGGNDFEPRAYPRHTTVSDGVIMNTAYTPDGRHGLSVTFEPHVIRQLEEDAFSDEIGRGLAHLAIFWAEELPHTIDYPREW